MRAFLTGALSLLVLVCAGTQAARAHPVTFKDGVAAFHTYRPKLLSSEINYSYSPKAAVGASHTLFKHEDDLDLHFGLLKHNWLARRWNRGASQANIYLSASLGARTTEGGDESAAGALELQADWETRRLYTQFNSSAFQSEGGKDFNHFRYRFGVAPYLAEFDEVQTFVIGQVSFTPEKSDAVSAGPIVRLFYDRYLGEIGWSFGSGIFATAMIHY